MGITQKLEEIFYNMGIYLDNEGFDEDLDLDSLQFVSLIVAIEQEFLIRISDSTFEDQQLVNFRDYINMVNKHFA
ncbi:acyl carrier protein [Bacillus cereus]|nr:acyl carrier protein [Bacillus cereus]